MAIEEIAAVRYRLHSSKWAPLCDNKLLLDNSNGIAGTPASKNSQRLCTPIECSKCISPFFGSGLIRVVFTESEDWICPNNVWEIAVAECWGAGGGGGGTDVAGTSESAGGGGGGGSIAIRKKIPTIPGTIYRVNVGVGGNGGWDFIGVMSNGAAGGDTWIVNEFTVLAKGGSGGEKGESDELSDGGTGGLDNFCVGEVKWSGGNGAGGVPLFYGGGGGSSAGHHEPGVNAVSSSGATAFAGGADGGDSGDYGTPGGGGGGGGFHSGLYTLPPGKGGDGKAIIYYRIDPQGGNGT